MILDISCPKCGAINRSTSRFCARCGSSLHPQPAEGQGEPEQKEEEALELPWLRTVQERATKPPTSRLTGEQVAQAASGATQAPEGATAAPPEGAPAATPEAQAPSPAQEQPPTPEPIPLRPARKGHGQPPGSGPQRGQKPEGERHAPESPQAGQTGKGGAEEPPPQWVVDILEPTGARPPEQTYEPEELAHIMPWVYSPEGGGEGEGEGEGEAGPPAPQQPGLPPWLTDVTVQETLESTSQQEPAPLPELELEGIEPFVPPTEEETAGQPAARQPVEVPRWLRKVTGQPEPLAEPAAEDLRKATNLSQISMAATGPEETGAPAVTRDIPVRAPRPGAVEALSALLQPGTADLAPRPVPGAMGAKIREAELSAWQRGLRWLLPDGLIYLLILASLLAVLIVRPPFGEVSAPSARDVEQFYSAVEAVPAGKPVLLVYDWDATRSAEMSALSQVVMRHLMSKKVPFVTISTAPQGPGFAQLVASMLASDTSSNYGYEYGRDYLVLGYLPGNEAALTALATNFENSLPYDYVHSRSALDQPILQNGKIQGLSDFGLIVDLASGEADLRLWIEQVGTRTNVPIVAAVPQGLEPIARPYRTVPRPGTQMTALEAVISGPAAALQYTRQLQLHGLSTGSGSTSLTDRLNAQSVAQLLVAIIIVASLVGLGTRRILRR